MYASIHLQLSLNSPHSPNSISNSLHWECRVNHTQDVRLLLLYMRGLLLGKRDSLPMIYHNLQLRVHPLCKYCTRTYCTNKILLLVLHNQHYSNNSSSRVHLGCQHIHSCCIRNLSNQVMGFLPSMIDNFPMFISFGNIRHGLILYHRMSHTRTVYASKRHQLSLSIQYSPSSISKRVGSQCLDRHIQVFHLPSNSNQDLLLGIQDNSPMLE